MSASSMKTSLQLRLTVARAAEADPQREREDESFQNFTGKRLARTAILAYARSMTLRASRLRSACSSFSACNPSRAFSHISRPSGKFSTARVLFPQQSRALAPRKRTKPPSSRRSVWPNAARAASACALAHSIQSALARMKASMRSTESRIGARASSSPCGVMTSDRRRLARERTRR